RETGEMHEGYSIAAEHIREHYTDPPEEMKDASPQRIVRYREAMRTHLVAMTALEETILGRIEALNRPAAGVPEVQHQ
ncbi:MAG: hypothetical protein IJT34_07730, partial [Butyrivibrio sp.]|nr:hypothetical protein [Butyrivibrio sp.]